MVTDELSCMLMPNVPLVDADQNEMSVSVSPFVAAQDVHAGVFDAETLPRGRAVPRHRLAGRVVRHVRRPRRPGAPVCSWT